MATISVVCHTTLSIYFASKALIALCIGFLILFRVIFIEVSHLYDDVIRVGTQILNSCCCWCTERECSAKVRIYNDVFKVDQLIGMLSCEALLFCN